MSDSPRKNAREADNDGAKQRDETQPRKTPAGEVSISAISHVGPTLESDPDYLETAGSSEPTPETTIAAGLGVDEENRRDMLERGLESERLKGTAEVPDEPLKTRLPGDTSSDPHTDVGPDNATTVQQRGEGRRKAA